MSVFICTQQGTGWARRAGLEIHPPHSLMTVATNGLMNSTEAKDLEVSIQFLIFLNVGS